MTIVRLRGQYSQRFSANIQASLYAGGVWGRYRDNSGLVLADVPGIGALGAAPDDSAWVEAGARIGYDIGRFTIELFGDVGTGEDGVGDGAHAGIAFRLRL